MDEHTIRVDAVAIAHGREKSGLRVPVCITGAQNPIYAPGGGRAAEIYFVKILLA